MKPTARRTRRPADVAWGYFYRNSYTKQRALAVYMNLDRCITAHVDAHPEHEAGPVFRITPPAQIRKPRKKVSRGR